MRGTTLRGKAPYPGSWVCWFDDDCCPDTHFSLTVGVFDRGTCYELTMLMGDRLVKRSFLKEARGKDWRVFDA